MCISRDVSNTRFSAVANIYTYLTAECAKSYSFRFHSKSEEENEMKLNNVGSRQAHQASPSTMISAFYLFIYIYFSIIHLVWTYVTRNEYFLFIITAIRS